MKDMSWSLKSLKDTSIKTRIETKKEEAFYLLFWSLKDTSIKTRIETCMPYLLYRVVSICLKDTSIKTRIETVTNRDQINLD